MDLITCKGCNRELEKSIENFYPTKTGFKIWRCRKCYAGITGKLSSEFRRKVKATLVQEAGGKCEICGYDKSIWALQFHHLDPKTKTANLGQYGKSLERAREEAKKCILVCANCHFELEEKRAIGEVD